MKKLTQILFGLLMGAFVLTFASCANTTDGTTESTSSSSSSDAYLPSEFSSETISALYTGEMEESFDGSSYVITRAVYFFESKAFVVTDSISGEVSGAQQVIKVPVFKGTYELSGTFTNGTISLTYTHYYSETNSGSLVWKEFSDDDDLSELPTELKVSGGKVTVPMSSLTDEETNVTFTKQ